MKKFYIFIPAFFSLILFISATVWEGAATVASSTELPENGLYIATNSFPLNTVVDVTNLDNGKTVRVVTSSGIDNPGLLALLSRDAAGAIDIQARSVSRIRIEQGPSQVPLVRSADGPSFSGDPDYDPAALVALNGINPFLAQGTENSDGRIGGNSRVEGGEAIIDLPGGNTQLIRGEDPYPASRPYIPSNPQQYADTYSDLSLIPAETRPPQAALEPDPEFFIPEIAPIAVGRVPDNPDYIDPSLIIPAVGVVDSAVLQSSLPQQSDQLPPQSFAPYQNELILPNQFLPPETAIELSQDDSVNGAGNNPLGIFPAPMINDLEKGMYYIQIAAYSKEETVRSEISKLDRNLPVAIMNAGNNEKPVYRILIGPVSLGESGALLQRFKANFSDAFVRLGR